MKVFGMTVARTKDLQAVFGQWAAPLMGWIHESFAGAWQNNVTVAPTAQNATKFGAVYTCLSLISGDISKMMLWLTESQVDGTWRQVTDSPFLSVLRKPNGYQTRIQFIESWITSKLLHGNTYVLKERDKRGVVNGLHVLDPTRVTPLVSDSGDVFYRLKKDRLAQLSQDDFVVPASEIIHDRMICLWHPLIGVSPLYACGMSAMQGVAIQTNAEQFFRNMSRPSGLLVAPGKISKESADAIKTSWQTNFSGANMGKLAVLGDGMEYKPMTIPPVDAQLLGQLDWTVGDVGRCFHVPPYKLGLDTNLTFTNAGQMDLDYYKQCLQKLIEASELLMGEGIELPSRLRIEFDIEGLLRMDLQGQAEVDKTEILGGTLAPNEARKKRNRPPAIGGDSPMLQAQMYSLAALAKRDSSADPFAKAPPPAPPPANDEEVARSVAERLLPALSERKIDVAVNMPESSIKELSATIATRFADLERKVADAPDQLRLMFDQRMAAAKPVDDEDASAFAAALIQRFAVA